MREEFKITRQGKEYVLYAGLLDEAHAMFDKLRIETKLVQIPLSGGAPTGEQCAIVEATFIGYIHKLSDQTPAVCTMGIGASPRPKETKGPPADSPIEMAETRAKARALRDAVNVGATSLEEMPSEDETPRRQASRERANPPRSEPEHHQEEDFEPITKQTRQQIEILAAELADLRGEDYDKHMESLEQEIGEALEDTTEQEGQKWLGRYKRAINKAKKE